MAYMVIDIFLDKRKAEIQAEAYRNKGRKKVQILETKQIVVNDCTGDQCIAKYDRDAATTLYIVSSEG